MHGTAVTFKVTAVFENSRTCRYFKDIYALRSLKINGYKRWAFLPSLSCIITFLVYNLVVISLGHR